MQLVKIAPKKKKKKRLTAAKNGYRWKLHEEHKTWTAESYQEALTDKARESKF